jgi:hypothetical protein
MNSIHAPVGRIRDIAFRIKQLQDKLMSSNRLTYPEQTSIHNEIKSLRKELDIMEERTRAVSASSAQSRRPATRSTAFAF